MLVCDITLIDTQTTAIGSTSVNWSLSNTVANVTTCYVTGNYTGSTAGSNSNGLRASVVATSGRADVDVLVSTSAATALAAHLVGAVGAHAASAGNVFAPAGLIVATDVQAAVAEVATGAATALAAQAGDRAQVAGSVGRVNITSGHSLNAIVGRRQRGPSVAAGRPAERT